MLPTYCRWHIQVDEKVVAIAEVQVEAIVGSDLRQGSGTAGPATVVIELASLEVVVGVVESVSVGGERFGSQDGVVHHTLHAVAIARVARNPQQITRELEVRVGSAGRLETMVSPGEAGETI